jgi:hypothetical protein
VNSSFIMLQLEAALVELVFMLYMPCSICFAALLLVRLVACSDSLSINVDSCFKVANFDLNSTT